MRRGTGPLARLIRARRLDRNPLRRSSDRTETLLLGGLLAAFLGIAPFAAYTAGTCAYAAFAKEAQVQRATLRQVSATLVQVPSGMTAFPGGEYGPAIVEARWRVPGGRIRTGILVRPPGATAGSTVPVWVDWAGQLTDAPLGRIQLATRAELAGGAAVAALAITLIAAWWLARRFLDRRRIAAWDAEWMATAPWWRPRL